MDRKKMSFDWDPFVLMCIMIALAMVLTWVVPAGEFDRVTDTATKRVLVVPGTYQVVEKNPVTPWGAFLSIFKGLVKGADTILFILVIGGSMEVLKATGAITTGLKSAIKRLGNRGALIIPVCMVLFSLGGAILGWAESGLVWIPILVPLAMSLGWDSLTGLAVVLVGMNAGFSAGMLNPFTVGIAQGIVGLPIFSGLEFRLILWAVTTAAAIIYVYRWARKVKADPRASPMYEEDKLREDSFDIGAAGLNKQQGRALVCFIVALIVMTYGIMELHWWFTEMATVFMIMAISAGLSGGLNANRISKEFIKGAMSLVGGAMIVGFGIAISLVLQDGKIIDTVVYGASRVIQQFPHLLHGTAQYLAQAVLEFFIPSASGQAAATLPIMAPLADITGITRQTAVLAYHLGDGFANIIEPTCGYFMACLAVAGVAWPKWVKFFWPLMLVNVVISIGATVMAVLISYGPF